MSYAYNIDKLQVRLELGRVNSETFSVDSPGRSGTTDVDDRARDALPWKFDGGWKMTSATKGKHVAREGRRPYNGPLKDDVYFEAVSPSPYYNFLTDSPVTQYDVRKDQVLLGVIWFSDSDDAGGFMSAAACGGRGKNASVEWNQQLRQAKAAGLGPRQAVQNLARDVDLGQYGRIDTASMRHFADLAAVEAFTAEH